MAFDPAVIVSLLLAEGLYLRAVHVLGRRGWHVPAGQQLLFHAGIAMFTVGLIGPFGALSEELLWAHMAEHVLIADLGAPLVLAGVRTPVLVHLLPRPALVKVARSRPLRGAFRFVRRPLVALPLWVVALYVWHLPSLYEGALRSDLLHALEHACFVVTSLLVWWPAVEPKKARMPGELWKAGYLIGSRVAGMFLGVAFVAMREPVYDGFYGDAAREHGLSPLADQQIAGGIMMVTDAAIAMFALAFFFWRAAQDNDRAERAALTAR